MSFKQDCYIALKLNGGDFYKTAEYMGLTPAQLSSIFHSTPRKLKARKVKPVKQVVYDGRICDKRNCIACSDPTCKYRSEPES